MPRQKVTFTNNLGIELAGSLETPKAGTPIRSYALFAHCFTRVDVELLLLDDPKVLLF